MRAAVTLLILLAACDRTPETRRGGGEAAMAAKAVADVDAATAEASQGSAAASKSGTNPPS